MGTNTKSIFTSKTNWTMVIGLVANVLTINGVHVLDDPATQLLIINTLMALFGIIFRTTATQALHVVSPVALVFVVLAGLGLSACNTSGVAPVIDNSVAAAEVTLTAAERTALIYTSLPRCPKVTICSDPVIVAKIRRLDNEAYDAVKLARKDAGLISGAIAAIAAFQAVIPTVPAAAN